MFHKPYTATENNSGRAVGWGGGWNSGGTAAEPHSSARSVEAQQIMQFFRGLKRLSRSKTYLNYIHIVDFVALRST